MNNPYRFLWASFIKICKRGFLLLSVSKSTPPMVFCPLLKKSSEDPYLKFLDFSQLLVADTSMNFFFFQKIGLHPPKAIFGHPVARYFSHFCFNQKNLFTNPSWNIFRNHTFFFKHFCLQPVTALLWHPVQKHFYIICFNQKILFTTPYWNIF